MTQHMDTKKLYDLADKFINLANTESQIDPSGNVGMGLRFAAARYSAFEASLQATNMAKEKDSIKNRLIEDYKIMLEENLQVYIKHLEVEANQVNYSS